MRKRLPRRTKKKFIKVFGRSEYFYQKMLLEQKQLRLSFFDNQQFQKVPKQRLKYKINEKETV